MSSRVLGLDVVLPGDNVTNTSFASRHPCKGYELVVWSIRDDIPAESSHLEWRADDFASYLEGGGRVFAMGVSASYEAYEEGYTGGFWQDLGDVLPMGGMAPVDVELEQVQGIGAQGNALVDVAEGAWQPLSYFEDKPASVLPLIAKALSGAPDVDADPASGPAAIDLMRIPNAQEPVARAIGVGSGWLFLVPWLRQRSEETLARIVEWALAYSPETPSQKRPGWVGTIGIGDEAAKMLELARLDDEISALGAQRSRVSDSIEELARWKALVYATGGELQTIIDEAFKLLGFEVLAVEKGRADHRLELNGQRVVVEAKGKAGSAAEADATQLEKWVSTEFDETEAHAKAILVVNGWRKHSLDDRHEAVFPDQMLQYSKAREHCLISGAQLLGIVNAVLNDPSQSEHYAQALLDQVGVFGEFVDPAATLDRIDQEDS